MQPTQFELRKSRMSTRDIQDELNMIRLAYRERGEPLNRKKSLLPWFGLGMVIGSIAAAIHIF